MHLVLGLVFAGFIVAGGFAILRGLRHAAALRSAPPSAPRTPDEEIALVRQRAVPVLMYVIAVPLIVFGIAGLGTILTVAGR